jgi:hypothetical protein
MKYTVVDHYAVIYFMSWKLNKEQKKKYKINTATDILSICVDMKSWAGRNIRNIEQFYRFFTHLVGVVTWLENGSSLAS